ncbi:protein adenylyltransferase FICD-like isoform X2 [Babylonia areolata]|uniref:protein adenylyltransferase FICD-like isoform X2 n=1 Tax=Babylonia areolata TaxID=304850 RepID=UPI003FD66F0E
MADWLTPLWTRQLKSVIHSLCFTFKTPSMNRKFLSLILLLGMFGFCLVTYLLEFTNFSHSNRQLFCTAAGGTDTVTDVGVHTGTDSCRPPDTSPVALRVRHKLPVKSDVKKEATAALNLALDLQDKGQTQKAQKVFQHALKLDPGHIDILTAYGEFLEVHMNDMLQADHYYKIALKVGPTHSKALMNRQRTSPIVEEMDQKNLNRIDHKRALFYTVPATNPALLQAKDDAYFAHIYHSNAIEGNTLTLSQTRAIIETRTAVGGKSLAEQNEVLGLDAALRYLNSTLVGRDSSLSLQDMLDIHQLVLGYVDPAQAGRYRSTQVVVGQFVPAPPSDVPALMDAMLRWLNSEETLSMHPIEFAAAAHYELVFIHPFHDGNGRTSRLLMNLILMKAGYPPVSVLVEDRMRYYKTLEMANSGDIRPFIRLIAESTERTLDEYLTATMDSSAHSLQQTSDLESNNIKQQRIA